MAISIPTNNAASVKVLDSAYQISVQSAQAGLRPAVALSEQYNHACARGAQAVAAALTNNPSVYQQTAGNAWQSRNNFQQTGLYNSAKEYLPGAPETSASFLNSLPVGSVVSFNYPPYGHQMTKYGVDPTTGQSLWSSDNVNDKPDSFLAKSNLTGIAIATPNDAGINAITNANPDLVASLGGSLTPANGYTTGGSSTSFGSSFVSAPTIANNGGVTLSPTLQPPPNNPITGDQLITLNDQYFNSVGQGGFAPVVPLQTLQARAQQPYSNRQFVSPVSLRINVEGTYKDIDFLQKPLLSNNYNPFKTNAVLSINQGSVNKTGIAVNKSSDRKSRTLNLKYSVPQQTSGIAAKIASQASSYAGQLVGIFAGQQNLTQSIFNAGNSAITQNLGSRVTASLSPITSNSYVNAGASALGSLTNLPIQNALANPLNTATSLLGSAVVKALDIRTSLPGTNNPTTGTPYGINLGSFPQIFSLAGSIAASGPPTTIGGAIAIEQQIKEIVCTFKAIVINLPPIKDILKGISISDLKLKIQREIDKIKQQVKDFFSIHHLEQLLEDLIPDPNDLLQALYEEFFKCNNSPAAAKNNISGQPDAGSSTAPTATAPAFTPPPVVSPLKQIK
jgi:hypothetical protein